MKLSCHTRFLPLGRRIASRCIAIAIAVSFIATVLPIAIASADDSSTMPCCVGKTAGHCDSGISPAKPPQPKPEPMCGQDSSELEDDGITIVAEPSSHETHHSQGENAESTSSYRAAQSLALSQPCQMDCGVCTSAASRQQKREKLIAQARTRHASMSGIISYVDNPPHFFSSNEDWSRINPRGPPASL